MRVVTLLFVMICALPPGQAHAQTPSGDWPDVGGSAAGTRYTALTQITPANVSQLRLAWQYKLDTPVETVKHPYVAFEVTPLKVGDTVYFCTPTNSVVALDAETGQPRWKFLPQLRKWGGFRACRGVAYYHSNVAGAGECQDRIITATMDAHIFAVDAHSGKACMSFGD